ncbi:MAG: PDZ domain-containing protein [Candidatus Omnitrophica bacterium]|nr:PDZ domain-containing protein [Candidatus Omnitrophota bacterium]
MKRFLLFFFLFTLIYPISAIGKEKSDDYSIIYERNIFAGSTAKKEIKTILKLIEVPLSERLLIKGIIIRGKNSSLAVIENRETKREDLYQVGDILLEGKVVLIEENRVVIRDKENKEITLFFAYGKEASSKSLVLRPSQQRPKVLGMKEILNELKTKLPLLSRVRIKPVLVSGKVNGYRVTDIPTDPFFKAIGIKNGDLVKRVNGTLITSIPKAYEIYRNLKPDCTVKVDIVRDGKPVTLSYRLEQ